jgi:NADPH:quinone reductase-like Zn-dependent oxidoreductase
MAVVGGGGQAELAVVHERMLMPVPDNLEWTSAGGVPEVFTTAHDAVFTQAGLQSGERLLVHGGAGGVGTAAIQLGRAAGARVHATVRNPDLRGQVAELGAEVLAPEGFAEHGPFDVILELVGAPNLADNLNALDTGGRITVIGIGAGAKGELNLGLLMAKRARIHGSTLRARPLEGKASAARAMERSVLPLLATGAVRVPVSATYPLEQAAEAYERFAAGGKLGKIVLTVNS